MITLLARLLGGSTIAAWLVVGVLGAGAVGGAYLWATHQGYQRATLEWSVRYAEREAELQRLAFQELDRQAAANDAAKANEAARLAQLRNELAQRERELQEQSHEADIDPNAGRVGLGSDSVYRLNRIGGTR